jgi:hypothetical protein
MARAESRTVELNYRADISQLKAELSKLPGLTEKEAKAMVRNLDRQLKRTEAAAKKTTQASAKGFRDMADAAGDSEQALIGIADLLEKVSPEAADFARGLADVGGGLESVIKGGAGVARVLGPIGVAVGTAFIAYQHLNSELDAANEKMQKAAERTATLQRVLGAIEEEKITAALRAQVALGEESSEVLAGRESQARAEAKMAERRAMIEADIANTLAMQADIQQQIENLQPGIGAAQRSAELERVSIGLNQTLSVQEEQLTALNRETANLASEYFLATEEGVAKFGEALEENNARTIRTVEGIDKQAAALAQLQQITQSAQDSMLEGEDAIIRARDRQIAQIATLITDTETSAAAAEAMAAVSESAAAEIAAMNEEVTSAVNFEEVTADAQEAADNIEEAFRSMALNAGAFMGDVFGDFADAAQMVLGEALGQRMDLISANSEAFSKLSEEERKQQKEAHIEEQAALKEGALKLFRAEKSAAISSAIMSGAVAVLRALEQLGPVAGGIAAAGIAATTAAQVAVIAAQPPPTFHRGGGPDEINAVLRRGEGVLTQQGAAAVGGDAGIAALNRGESSSGRPIKVEFNVGSRVSQAILIDAQRAPGPGRRATRSSRPTGRRNPYGDR